MRRPFVALGVAASLVAASALPAAAAEARDIGSACPRAFLPDSGFTDLEGLPEGFVDAIECIVAYDVTQGTTAETFSPSGAVTRGQMATFLLRMLEATTGWTTPTDAPDAFGDDQGTTHEASANVLAAKGVVKGTGAGVFSPGAPVRRDQMATFVAAALKAAGAPGPASAGDAFGDDNGTVHEPSINSMAALGVVSGTGPGRYDPAAAVARRQMALFLARSLDVLVDANRAQLPFPPVGVAGEPEVLQYGQERTCAVGATAGATVNLLLLPPSSVTKSEDGGLVFADVDEDGLADQQAIAPWIGAAGGVGQPVDTRSVAVKSDGEVDVVLRAVDEGDAVLVAFIDAAGKTTGKLDLDLHGAPVDAAAAGCQTSWTPPEALLGTRAGVVVASVNVDLGYFTGSAASGERFTYYFDADNDVYEGKATDASAFEALLSFGDVVDVDYEPDPEGVSTFTTKTDTVRAPGEPTVTAVNADEGTTLNDLRVTFPVPAHNGAGTTYRVTRFETFKGAGGCDGTFLSQALSVGTTDASPFIDMNVAEGCWAYQVWALSPTGATKQSPISADAESGQPDTGDIVRPRSQYAVVSTDAGGDAKVSSGDVIKIRFDERMAEPEAGDFIRLTSGGSSVTLTHQSGAFFELNFGEETVGGQTVPRAFVLTVTVDDAPSVQVTYPATITAHTGVTDEAGNSWDIAASPDKGKSVGTS